MLGDDEGRRPAANQPRFELGGKLDDLSVGELEARVALLRAEIARLEAARSAKQAAATAALAFFKT